MDLSWWPDWSGQTAIVVASGPSAKTADLTSAKGKARIIAVNSSWELCPWADVLYACDYSWWKFHNGVPEFKGLKISQHARCPSNFPDIKLVTCVRSFEQGAKIYTADRGRIGWGPSGGFQALNLAVQFGSKKIILVGFDMRIDRGLHWHGPHQTTKGIGKRAEPTGLHNPHMGQVQRWRKILDGVRPELDRLGVSVINASLVSKLEKYPKMEFEKALA